MGHTKPHHGIVVSQGPAAGAAPHPKGCEAPSSIRDAVSLRILQPPVRLLAPWGSPRLRVDRSRNLRGRPPCGVLDGRAGQAGGTLSSKELVRTHWALPVGTPQPRSPQARHGQARHGQALDGSPFGGRSSKTAESSLTLSRI